jgi:hypothetical protein
MVDTIAVWGPRTVCVIFRAPRELGGAGIATDDAMRTDYPLLRGPSNGSDRAQHPQSADRHHGDGTQEGRSGPVQMQPPDPLDGDEEAGQAKDEERGGHERREQ